MLIERPSERRISHTDLALELSAVEPRNRMFLVRFKPKTILELPLAVALEFN